MRTKNRLGNITTGRIELGDNLTIKAGIYGGGTAETDIRIWAGATFAERATAPFRVDQSGKVFASAGVIGGWNLDINAIYTGTKSTADGFSTTGITLASDGSIHAPRFYINANGTVGIRSGTATGKRVVIDSINNRIDLFNENNEHVISIDDTMGGTFAWPGIKITGESGAVYAYHMHDGLHVWAGGTRRGYFEYDTANARMQLVTDTASTKVVLKGLPASASGLGANEVYRDSSGYLRMTAP